MAYTFPAVPVGAIFLVTLRLLMNGQRLLNTYHFRCAGNSNNRDIQTVSNQMNTHFGTVGTGLYATHNALRDTGCLLEDAQIQMINPDRYVPIGYALNMPGDILVDDLGLKTPNVAAVLTRRAVVGTRRGVSALHIPIALENSVMTNGELTVQAKTDVGDHGNAILGVGAIGDGITLEPVIYHRGAIPIADTIGSFIVQPQVRVMTRRTVGRGI